MDILSWIHSLGAPKRINSNIRPILQRCKNFEKLGNVFDRKLIQKSALRVFKSGIPQKSSTVDVMSWIHSLGPPRESVPIKDRFCRDVRISKKIGNVFDMKIIQNSEIRVFKSAIPVPPRESVAV